MLALSTLLSYLNESMEVSNFQDYCPNGLQIEGLHTDLKSIALAVSASELSIDKAIEFKADALIVHHGLFWKGDPYPITGIKKNKIKKLIENGIHLLAYHLPLDAQKEYGNNWKAAKDLNWDNLQPFGNLSSSQTIGVLGHFSSQPVETFQKTIEDYYKHPAHAALGGPKHIKSCALISGGAHKEIIQAAKAGVDCFITGSFDEPIWHLAHELKVNFFALGHSNTEEVGPKALAEHLHKKFQIACSFINLPNPF